MGLSEAVTSGQIGVDPETSPLSLLVVPVMIGLAVLLWRRRHRIEPEPASATEPAAGPDPGAVTKPAADAARPQSVLSLLTRFGLVN